MSRSASYMLIMMSSNYACAANPGLVVRLSWFFWHTILSVSINGMVPKLGSIPSWYLMRTLTLFMRLSGGVNVFMSPDSSLYILPLGNV